MKYQSNQIYHVYNQGNNKQKIFFSKYNYLLFLKKVRQYICPNAHILAYCLMPNHFHFLIFMKEVGCEDSQQLIAGFPYDEHYHLRPKQQNFSKNLSILLRSYTRAINKQNNRTGSLFRSKTKAKTETNDPFVNALKQNDVIAINYNQTCFNYIHQNPVKAGLVKIDTHWNYSSAIEHAGLVKADICNLELCKELGLVY